MGLAVENLGEFLVRPSLWPFIFFRWAPASARPEVDLCAHERARAFDNSAQPRHQRFRRHRFGKKFVDPRIASLANAVDPRVTGEHDERDVRIRALLRSSHQMSELESRHALKYTVEDDDIGIDVTELRPGTISGRRFRNIDDTEAAEDRANQPPHMLAAVDQQNPQLVDTII